MKISKNWSFVCPDAATGRAAVVSILLSEYVLCMLGIRCV